MQHTRRADKEATGLESSLDHKNGDEDRRHLDEVAGGPGAAEQLLRLVFSCCFNETYENLKRVTLSELTLLKRYVFVISHITKEWNDWFGKNELQPC